MQFEPKTNLTGLYDAETSFYGEYHTFSSDLVAVDWFPVGRHYVFGFVAPGGPASISGVAVDPTRDNSLDPRVIEAAQKAPGASPIHTPVDLRGNALRPDQLPAIAIVTSNGFVAAAAGDINPEDGLVKLDVWTIDQSKTLTNVRDDCSADE